MRRYQGRHPHRQFDLRGGQRPWHSDRHQGGRRPASLGRRDRHDGAARGRQVRPELVQGLRGAARRRRLGGERALRVAEAQGLAQWQDALHGIPRRRAGEAPGSRGRDRPARHRGALPRLARNIQPGRVPLRHPRQAPAGALLPQQRLQDRAHRPAHGKERELCAGWRRPGIRRVHEPLEDDPARQHLLRDRREGRHHGRGRDAVERLLWRVGAGLHQQHPATRRRHAPHRAAQRHDADHQQLHREGRDREEGEGRDHRRRHARGAGVCALRQGARAEVLLADQGEAGVLRGAPGGGGDRRREAARVPR